MMNKKDIFKKIGAIIGELNEQYEYLAKNPESLNELEMELFMANSKFLSDHIAILNKLNVPQMKPVSEAEEQHVQADKPENTVNGSEPEKSDNRLEEPEAKKEAEPEEHKTREEKPEEKEVLIKFDWPADEATVPEDDEPEDGPEISTEMKQEEQKSKNTETEPRFIPSQKQDEITRPEEKKSEPPATAAAGEPVVNEVKIAERTITVPVENIPAPVEKPLAPTVNELLFARSSQNNVAGQFNQPPVTDLKSIINLNDKLLFVKDLFNGYSLAYSEAIEILNRFDNMQAADNFLKTNYAAKNGWAAKQPTVDKLYAILNRRFP